MMEDLEGEGDEEEEEGSQPAESPAPELASEASTTQSLQEFRRSLTGAASPSHNPLPVPLSSLPLSSPSQASTHSLDNDEPLQLDEVDDFFSFQYDEDYTDEFITAALKHTCFRPVLAEGVLAAWAAGRSLPDKRGVWSREDDEDVESGDAKAMARLEGKHSFDGWGGITERLKFLEVYRSR
jgi:hypothetical protein